MKAVEKIRNIVEAINSQLMQLGGSGKPSPELSRSSSNHLFPFISRPSTNLFAQVGIWSEMGRELTPRKSVWMDLSLDKVRKVLKIAVEPISLETPIGEEEDNHIGDFLEINPPVTINVMAGSLGDQTHKALATLNLGKVLRMRFGIGEKSDHTLEEVGQNFDVTMWIPDRSKSTAKAPPLQK